jgi:multiple antibiotic resistance protein
MRNRFLKHLDALGLALGTLLLSAPTAVAQARAPVSTQGTVVTTLEIGKVFTYFFLMLGPLKLLGPFAKMTSGMDEAACRSLAVRGFGLACLGGLIAAFLGESILEKWSVSLPALLIAGGLVLLLVALQAVLAQYEPLPAPSVETKEAAHPAADYPRMALTPLAFPNIITPYGTAVFILLLAASPTRSREIAILAVFLGVMLLDLVAMWLARPILRHGAAGLAILGSVLGVVQVALAVQLLLAAGRLLGVLPPAAP